MTKVPLAVSSSITLATVGGVVTGTIQLAPSVYGAEWDVQRVTISTTSTTKSTFALYRNIVSPGNVLDTSDSGNDDVDETEIHMGTLDTLIGVWTGGDAGATATMSVYGDLETGRPY